MSEQAINVEQHGAVLVLTLAQPEKRNALSAAMCQEICRVITEAASGADAARAVLIKAEGPAFCAGADLGGGVYGDDFHTSLHAMLHAFLDSPLPVIASVQGPAVGAGTQLSLACDLRVVGERAWFGVPAAQLGFALDAWTLNRSKDLLGGAVARNVLLGMQRVSADQALALGFAATAGDDAAALEYAQQVAAQAPLALKQLKSVLNAHDGSYQLDEEGQALYAQCWASEDAKEARQARAEKRQPVFQGK